MSRTTGLLFLLVFAIASNALAQGTTSRVVGVVGDPQGAAIPGASVTLTNEETHVPFTTRTSHAGTYVFEAVQVGTYTVAVEMSGFKKFVSSGNRVTIGQPTTVNATLELGGVAETVEVSEAAQAVQTSSSGNFGSVIEQKVVQDLPIVGTRGRNPLTLVSFQPGVVDGANIGSGVHIHGARDRSWNYTLDGIDINETSAGGGNFTPLRPNPDMLAEMRILTSNFTAEFGRNSGGQVAMITRSGSNDLHGSVFYFYRTPAFNANEWENNVNKVGKRQFVQHIPGFSLGGPIQKNKTFFFLNVQGLRTHETGTFTRLVYTSQARAGNWRYVAGGRNQPAGVSGAVVDANGNPLPGVNVGNYNIPGNDPLGLGLDPTTQAAIRLTPLPNNFTVGDGLNVAGFTFVTPQTEKQGDIALKLDHVINERNLVFLRVAGGNQDTLCDRANGGEPRFPGLPCTVNTERRPRNVAANWRWTPGSRVTNELVAGFNHFTFNFDIPTADPTKPTFDFSGTLSTPSWVTVPDEFEVGNLRTINTYQLVDNLSLVSGAHNFKLGTNVRYQQHKDVRGSVGAANVSPLVNFSTGVNTVDPLAFRIPGDLNVTNDLPILQSHVNFLLGRVGTISQSFVSLGDRYGPGGTLFDFDARYPEADFYAQDNWKIGKNLTLDLGLRWEVKLSPRDPQDRIARPSVRVAEGEPPSNTLRWAKAKLYGDDWNNLAPSIGVAWDPTGSGKSSVRANYRMAYDRINTFLFSSVIFQSIPGITQSVFNTEFGTNGGRLGNLPALSPPPGNPQDLLQPPPVSTSSTHVVDPEFRSPRTHEWALSYQRELFPRTIFEATYIGHRADHLYGAYDANQVRIFDNGFLDAFNIVKAGGDSALMNQLLGPDTRRLAGETGSQMVRRLFATQLSQNSVAALAATLGRRVQGGRTLPELAGLGPFFFFAYPQFAGGMNVLDSGDRSRYHALELTVQRRFARGFGFMIGYTLSQSKDTRSFDPAFSTVRTGTNQSASSTPFDIHDRSLNYALSDFDRKHVVQARGVWEVPVGSGRRFLDRGGLLDTLLGGWEVSGLLVYQSGRPFTIYSGANTFTNLVSTPADCNGCSPDIGHLFDENGLRFFIDAEDRARFSIPGPGQLGNTGRNAFRGPNNFRIDFGMLKHFKFGKDDYLEYRIDVANLTNHPTFDFPTTTITSSVFGRIRDAVLSGSRKIQMGLKYVF
jgi:hypothetical protein